MFVVVKSIRKETIKTKYGKFNAIKLKPLLLKGSVFEGGEKMTIWVSDDGNHIPVRVESPIIVGSLKIDLMNYEKFEESNNCTSLSKHCYIGQKNY